MRIIKDIKPTARVDDIKPRMMVWKDVQTPHYITLYKGMPMGLLLTLTYNVDITIQIN